MNPMYYAGYADGMRYAIDCMKEIIPDHLMEWIHSNCDIQPNKGAGDPELSKEFNECLAAIQLFKEWR